MGRPKNVSDSEVLLLAFDVISHEGFESFTFEQVAKRTRLSPAALVKRFGSKKNLAYLARNQKWDDNLQRMSVGALDQLKGLSGVFEFVQLIAKSVDSKKLGEHARWLGTEADDPRNRRKLAAYFETTRGIFFRLIKEGIESGELSGIEEPRDFAMTLEALVQGLIFQFAFLEKQNIIVHLKKHIQTVLRPYIKAKV